MAPAQPWVRTNSTRSLRRFVLYLAKAGSINIGMRQHIINSLTRKCCTLSGESWTPNWIRHDFVSYTVIAQHRQYNKRHSCTTSIRSLFYRAQDRSITTDMVQRNLNSLIEKIILCSELGRAWYINTEPIGYPELLCKICYSFNFYSSPDLPD